MDINSFSDFIEKSGGSVKLLPDTSLPEFDPMVREIKELYADFKSGGEALIKEGNTLKIGIVGQVKAGKSSFLNSLFFDGESVLPKASTPMTAGLTVLEYSDKNEFLVEYYTEPEWSEFKNQDEAYCIIEKEVRNSQDCQGAPESFIIKEIKSRTSDVMQSAHELVTRCGKSAKSKIGRSGEVVPFNSLKDLQNILNQYVGSDGEYTSVVKMLTLKINDPRLKGIRIVDTPGVNDPIVSRENRTKEFLHSCHGVFFLSYSSRFFDSVDVNFMNSRIGSQGVGTILMLASKYDDVLQDQGIRFKDDIEEADNQSRKSLEKRFETQKSELVYPNIDIHFDTTSGISYALASKNESDWDEIEQHVDRRMHELFPSAFASKDDAKETYMLLANLDLIREDYLEKMFKGNKDKIIQNKISEYFVQNSQSLYQKVNELIDDVNHKLKQLDSVELQDIYNQEAKQSELFTLLKGEFSTYISEFQNSLQTAKDRISESLDVPHLYSLPTEDTEISVTHKGKIWGHNTDLFTVKMIDSQMLKNQLLDMINTYCGNWSNQWQDHFREARTKMFRSFSDALTEFSKDVSDVKFSDKYYRQLLTQLLSDIEKHGILKLQDIKTRYCSEMSDLCDSQSIVMGNQHYDSKESEVQSRLNQKSRDIAQNQKRILDNKLSSFVREVKASVDNSITPTVNGLSEMRKNIDVRLKSAGKDYLDNLKSQIEQKEAIKKKTEALLNCLEQLSKTLNSYQ